MLSRKASELFGKHTMNILVLVLLSATFKIHDSEGLSEGNTDDLDGAWQRFSQDFKKGSRSQRMSV